MDVSNPNLKTSGIRIDIKEYGRIVSETSAFIDLEEIDSLIKGIDYISKATKEITKQSNFEAEYRTKGEFRVIVFNDNQGALSVSVSCGRIRTSSLFIKIADLENLRRLLLEAKTKI